MAKRWDFTLLTGDVVNTDNQASSGAFVQLPVGNYESSAYVPMKMISPRPNGETSANYAYRRWQTGLPIDLPINVIGGQPPFGYYIDAASDQVVKDNLTVGEFLTRSGDKFVVNPNYGRLTGTISAPGSYSLVLRATDQAGNSVTETTTLDIGDHAVYFNSNAVGSSNLGTLADPYTDLESAIGANSGSNVNAGKLLVFRGGEHVLQTSSSENGQIVFASTNNRPFAWIGYPGETAVLNCRDGSHARGDGIQIALDGADQMFFGNLTFKGNHQWPGFNYQGAGVSKLFVLINNPDRTTFHDLEFVETRSYHASESNNGGIFYSANGNAFHNAWTRLRFPGINHSVGVFYGVNESLFEFFEIPSSYDRDSAGPVDFGGYQGVIYAKGIREKVSWRFIDIATDHTNTVLVSTFAWNNQYSQTTTGPQEMQYCKLGGPINKAGIKHVGDNMPNLHIARCSGSRGFEETGGSYYNCANGDGPGSVPGSGHIEDSNALDSNNDLQGTFRDDHLGQKGAEVAD